MRRAHHSIAWIQNENQTPAGLNLGYGYCAEHEWGLHTLERAFGLSPEQPAGMGSRQMTRGEEAVVFVCGQGLARSYGQTIELPFAVLRCDVQPQPRKTTSFGAAVQGVARAALAVFSLEDPPETHIPGQGRSKARVPVSTAQAVARQAAQEALFFFEDQIHPNVLERYLAKGNQVLETHWDSGGFQVVVLGEQAVAQLKALHEAFLRRDVCLLMRDTLPTQAPNADQVLREEPQGGLCLVIASQAPQAMSDQLLTADLAHRALREAALATGIEEALRAGGREVLTLTPRWADEAHSQLRFWMRPRNLAEAAIGWFSEQELRQWIAGEGPVVLRRKD